MDLVCANGCNGKTPANKTSTLEKYKEQFYPERSHHFHALGCGNRNYFPSLIRPDVVFRFAQKNRQNSRQV
jgi:hypothetical protein